MPCTEVPKERVPIRMWADPDEVETAAMEQLRNVTRVPWVHGLAVMPDVHHGQWISCHHSYVAEETYDGVDVLVTRKGAIHAGRVSSGSSRAAWRAGPTSCAGWATPPRSTPPRTGRGAG